MKISSAAAVAAVSVMLCGCGTIIQGTHEDIAVTTTPDGAHCELMRKNEHVATIDSTPQKVTVSKTKDDILLTCKKADFQDSSQYLHSGMAPGTFGNIIAGGVIGWGVDSATGADNEYPETVNVQMVPVGGAAPTPPPPPVVKNSVMPTS